MGFCKDFSRRDTGGMDGNAVDDRIRAGKVNIFKDTEFFLFFSAMLASGNDSVFAEYQDLAWLYIPYDFGAYRFYGAAFRGDYICPVRCFSLA